MQGRLRRDCRKIFMRLKSFDGLKDDGLVEDLLAVRSCQENSIGFMSKSR
jgi:hypothetical protein